MSPSEHAHSPRPKFDTLFADPRHYRGDCRLMRTAIRRGWLNDAPQADRDALLARFEAAAGERRAADPSNIRAALAEVWAMLEAERADQVPLLRALRYAWAGELTDRATGRPRERWHVSELTGRIDAGELRRRAKAEGTDLRTLRAIEVRPADSPDDSGDGDAPRPRKFHRVKPSERIALAVAADARYGWRVWLVCPRCGRRRMHLYPTRAGVRCRVCAGIAYKQQ